MNREEHTIDIAIDEDGLWCTWRAPNSVKTYMFIGKNNEDYINFMNRITTLANSGIDIQAEKNYERTR